MPIHIYCSEEPQERLAWLCDGNWHLADQVTTLNNWLTEHKSKIRTGDYIADIGFSPRENSCGGGAVISPEMMQTMASLGMSLFLSEYAGDEEG